MITTADMAHDIYPQPRRSARHEREVAIRRAGYALLALASDLEALPRDADTSDVERDIAEVIGRVALS